MSHPASPEAVGVADRQDPGTVFRLHPLVRRDVLAVAGLGGLGCLITALATMQAFPALRTPAAAAVVLAIEALGITAAAACGVWALGLAVQVDAQGVRRSNLVFPERPGRRLAWSELVGAELRPWSMSARAGYPSRRAVLLLRDGKEAPLPPLDDPWGLVELVRARLRFEAGAGRAGSRT